MAIRSMSSRIPLLRSGLVTQACAWNGIAAEARVSPTQSTSMAKRLTHATLEADAILLVVGGFGHSPIREHLFGGVTRDLLEECCLPLFLTH